MLTDKRACARVNAEIRCRFSCQSESGDQDCVLTNISLGGAFLACARVQPVGTHIVLCADGFGKIAGVVARTSPGGMGISFDGATSVREKMAEKILRYLDGNSEGADQAWRQQLLEMPRQFTRPTGEQVSFSLLDLSLTGALLVTEVKPPVGELLAIGNTSGRVVRHVPQGVSVEFVTQ
jgi:hypothetical protein